ncbi:MAG: YraN family protein [Elusimicrobiota bacterium]|jgi:putative endonuclease|nr:YraN family protein [Elusimicrobiota bacterium]
MQNKREIGFEKEKEAVKFLQNNGYTIVEMNFSAKCGEIDIIAKDSDCLCFVEVKYRKNTEYGTPIEAVSVKKQKRISRTAMLYLKIRNIKSDFRFDIVSITGTQIEIIKSAFTTPAGKYYI